MPRHAVGVPRSARSRSSACRRSPASSRRTRSSPRRWTAARTATSSGRRARRRVPDRALHVPDAVHRLRRRAESAFVQEHFHAPHARRGRAGRWACPVGVLAVLAVVGGWIQFAPRLEPVDELARCRSRAPLAEADGLAGGGREHRSRVALGLAGIAVAWWIYSAQARAGRSSPSRSACSSTSSTSTSCTTRLFYRPAVVARQGPLPRLSRSPLIDGSIRRRRRRRVVPARRVVARLQTGLVRTYVLALAAGRRRPRHRLHRGQMTTLHHDPDPPAARGRAPHLGAAAAARLGRRPRAARLARSRSASGSSRSSATTSRRAASSSSQQATGSATCTSRTTSASTASRSGSSGSRSSRWRRRSRTGSGSAATGRAPTSG